MAPELGIFALILAFVLSLSQAFFGLVGAWRERPSWMAVARPAVRWRGWLPEVYAARMSGLSKKPLCWRRSTSQASPQYSWTRNKAVTWWDRRTWPWR